MGDHFVQSTMPGADDIHLAPLLSDSPGGDLLESLESYTNFFSQADPLFGCQPSSMASIGGANSVPASIGGVGGAPSVESICGMSGASSSMASIGGVGGAPSSMASIDGVSDFNHLTSGGAVTMHGGMMASNTTSYSSDGTGMIPAAFDQVGSLSSSGVAVHQAAAGDGHVHGLLESTHCLPPVSHQQQLPVSHLQQLPGSHHQQLQPFNQQQLVADVAAGVQYMPPSVSLVAAGNGQQDAMMAPSPQQQDAMVAPSPQRQDAMVAPPPQQQLHQPSLRSVSEESDDSAPLSRWLSHRPASLQPARSSAAPTPVSQPGPTTATPVSQPAPTTTTPAPTTAPPTAAGRRQQQSKPAATTSPRRRKQQRDPNEPQRPVSAYALFFRDTQSAIKGHNPGATFGQVSRIVASMWEALETNSKAVYKSRADGAKQEYLKALTAYRAGLASPTASTASSVRLKQLPSPASTAIVDASDPTDDKTSKSDESESPLVAAPSTGNQPSAVRPSPVCQSKVEAPVAAAALQQDVQQRQEPAVVAQVPQQQLQSSLSSSDPAGSAAPQQTGVKRVATKVPAAPTSDAPSIVVNGVSTSRECVRPGCGRAAVADPEWDGEYCSSGCVVVHCTHVFNGWVADRNTPPDALTVSS